MEQQLSALFTKLLALACTDHGSFSVTTDNLCFPLDFSTSFQLRIPLHSVRALCDTDLSLFWKAYSLNAQERGRRLAVL